MGKTNIKIILKIIGVYFVVITIGFLLVLTASNFILSLFDKLIDSKTIIIILEYALAWPLVICAMLILYKWIEKKYAKYEIKPYILALIPTIEACIFYSIIFLYELKSPKIALPILYAVFVFIIIYIVDLIINRINYKKQ